MGEITITLNGDQADIARRAVARDAIGTTEAISANLERVVDGHSKEEKARFNRGSLTYCVNQLGTAISILNELPWSDEAERELGLEAVAEEEGS